ncbi:hypothetical protein FACS1894110_26570 [Spirochaetia bacterium]|nr:hypothetical protein FACS1894110_26570 [Spirochaetia bacterium]
MTGSLLSAANARALDAEAAASWVIFREARYASAFAMFSLPLSFTILMPVPNRSTTFLRAA